MGERGMRLKQVALLKDQHMDRITIKQLGWGVEGFYLVKVLDRTIDYIDYGLCIGSGLYCSLLVDTSITSNSILMVRFDLRDRMFLLFP